LEEDIDDEIVENVMEEVVVDEKYVELEMMMMMDI
jgi:hypothetical protein